MAYEVMVAPPSDAGGDHQTVADASPARATTLPGAVGTTAKNVNWSALDVALVPCTVTVTSTVPGEWLGLVAVICVSESTWKLVAAVVPKSTSTAPVNPVPVIVTLVPPGAAPLTGLTLLTAGGVQRFSVSVWDVPVASAKPAAQTSREEIAAAANRSLFVLGFALVTWAQPVPFHCSMSV